MENAVSGSQNSYWRHLLLGAVFLLAGCTTVDDLRDAKDEAGGMDSFDAPFEMTFDEAVNVLKYQGADIIEANKDGKYIFAKQGIAHAELTFFSYGEMLALYFDNPTPNNTRIKMVEKKRVKTLLFKNEWAVSFFMMLRQQLERKQKSLNP